VAAASSGGLYVRAVFIGLPGPVMQQDVGTGDGSAGTEEYGQEQEGDEPALHDHSIACRSSPWQTSRSRAPCHMRHLTNDLLAGATPVRATPVTGV
jgi:hypothetical protein